MSNTSKREPSDVAGAEGVTPIAPRVVRHTGDRDGQAIDSDRSAPDASDGLALLESPMILGSPSARGSSGGSGGQSPPMAREAGPSVHTKTNLDRSPVTYIVLTIDRLPSTEFEATLAELIRQTTRGLARAARKNLLTTRNALRWVVETSNERTFLNVAFAVLAPRERLERELGAVGIDGVQTTIEILPSNPEGKST